MSSRWNKFLLLPSGSNNFRKQRRFKELLKTTTPFRRWEIWSRLGGPNSRKFPNSRLWMQTRGGRCWERWSYLPSLCQVKIVFPISSFRTRAKWRKWNNFLKTRRRTRGSRSISTRWRGSRSLRSWSICRTSRLKRKGRSLRRSTGSIKKKERRKVGK